MITHRSQKNYYVLFLGLFLLSLPLGIVSIGSFGSILRFIGILPIIGWVLWSQKIRFNRVLNFQILLTILMLISASYAINPDAALSRFFTNVFFMVLIAIFSSVSLDRINFNRLSNFLIFSSRITAVIVLILGTYSENRLLLGDIFIEDPNYLTGYFVFGVINTLFIIIDRTKGNKLLSIFELSIYMFIILSTGSRTGLISYVVIFFIILMSKLNLKKIFYGLFTIILIIILTTIIIQFIDVRILERFSLQNIIDSDGTGRFVLWKNAFVIYEQSTVIKKLFGYGAGNIREAYNMFGYIPIVSHNIFIDILIENGFAGLIVYLFMTIYSLLYSYKNMDKRFFYMLLVILIMSFGSSFYAYKVYWNIILICVTPIIGSNIQMVSKNG